jgi:hypothetical protein
MADSAALTTTERARRSSNAWAEAPDGLRGYSIAQWHRINEYLAQELPSEKISADTLELFIQAALRKVEGEAALLSHLPADHKAGDMAPRVEVVTRQGSQPRARRALELLQVLVPKRIADEEIGDALEVINALPAGPGSRWTRVLVWVKVITTYFWTILHTFREKAMAAGSKKTE